MPTPSNTANSSQWKRLRQWWAQQLPLPCARCGETVYPNDDWHLDHMTPRWAGGTDDTARPSHAYCNMRLSNEHPRPQYSKQLVESAPPITSRRW